MKTWAGQSRGIPEQPSEKSLNKKEATGCRHWGAESRETVWEPGPGAARVFPKVMRLETASGRKGILPGSLVQCWCCFITHPRPTHPPEQVATASSYLRKIHDKTYLDFEVYPDQPNSSCRHSTHYLVPLNYLHGLDYILKMWICFVSFLLTSLRWRLFALQCLNYFPPFITFT